MMSSSSSVDSGFAWMIPFSCFVIQGTLFGTYRSYSLLYTVLLDTFAVSRSDASWPVSLCMTMIHLTGPVSGSLNRYFSVRSISLFGCLLSAIGVAVCFLAEDSIAVIVVGIGVIQGFGIGLTYVQSAFIINQYFDKHRATANGINLSGGTVGAFAMSFVLEWALQTYEFRDCFLVLAGVILLTLPFCLLLIPFRGKEQQLDLDNCHPEAGVATIRRLSLTDASIRASVESNLSCITRVTDLNLPDDVHKSTTHLIPVNGSPKYYASNLLTAGMIRRASVPEAGPEVIDRDRGSSDAGKRNPDDPHLNRPVLSLPAKKSLTPSIMTTTSFVQEESVWKSILILFKDPMFGLIAMTHIAYFWGSITYLMIEVDFAVDHGVSLADGVNLITAFSVGDLIGRLGSGPLLDREFIPLKIVAMLCSLGNGVFMAGAITLNSYWPLVVFSAILGFISGVINVLLNQLFCKYIGSEKAALAFGTSAFLCGIVTTVRPLFVGSFRDGDNGSYDGLLVCLGILSIFSGILWFFEPMIMRRRPEQKEIPS